MNIDVLGVYLVDFKDNTGGELSGLHYAFILSDVSSKDGTLLVAPITGKKPNRKYRGGITIDCNKYQHNPRYNRAFIKVRKIREIDKSRIISKKRYQLDSKDTKRLESKFHEFFIFLDDL